MEADIASTRRTRRNGTGTVDGSVWKLPVNLYDAAGASRGGRDEEAFISSSFNNLYDDCFRWDGRFG